MGKRGGGKSRGEKIVETGREGGRRRRRRRRSGEEGWEDEMCKD